MTSAIQEPYKVEAYGTVVPPPSLAEIVDRLVEAAANKQPAHLTPGETRILADHLRGN